MHKGGAEVARVGSLAVLDISSAEAGTAKMTWTGRPADRDWAEEAGDSATLRLEWPDDGAGPPTRLVMDRPAQAAPPSWVDAIAHSEHGLVRIRLRRGADGSPPVPVGFEVRSEADVTSRSLRRLGLGWLVGAVDEALTHWAVGQVLGEAWHKPVHRPGRSGRPDVFYAQWAARYEKALEAAPAAPVKHLIRNEEAAGRHATAGQIRAYLNRARERGLLTDAPAGRAGGQMTDEARRLLKSAGMETS